MIYIYTESCGVGLLRDHEITAAAVCMCIDWGPALWKLQLGILGPEIYQWSLSGHQERDPDKQNIMTHINLNGELIKQPIDGPSHQQKTVPDKIACKGKLLLYISLLVLDGTRGPFREFCVKKPSKCMALLTPAGYVELCSLSVCHYLKKGFII